MAMKGQLTKAQFGPSMPVTAPAAQAPPFYYRRMEMIIVDYISDEHEAARLLPEGLTLTDPVTATLIIAKYHFSTFGPYNEAILGIACEWQGERMMYLPNLFVTHETPLIAGREIWGYAKKLATIDLIQEHEEYMGIVERPKGNRIATAVMRTIHNVPAHNFSIPPILSLKVIPSAEENHTPDIAQLVACHFKVTPIIGSDEVTELWNGPGSLVYNSATEADPWYKLAVKEVVSCRYGWFNGYLPCGKVLKSY